MLQDTSISINPAVSIENDPVLGPQKQQELSLSYNSDIQSIERSAARLTASRTSVLPDLTITGRTLPSSSYAGDQINFTYTVKNAGKAQAGESTTKFWLSLDKKWDSSDISLSSDEVGTINFGQSTVESASFKIDAEQAAGKYYILMQADANNVVVESNENNNLLAAPITVKTKSDLIISNVEVEPYSVYAGDKITICYTENNISTTTAGKHRTAIYLSQDDIFDSSDVLYASVNEKSLAGGTSRTVSKTLTVDSSLVSGDYYFLVVGDSGNAIVENDENNNIGYTYVAIAEKPDLTISSLSVPTTTVRPGERITLNFTEQNLGRGADSGHSTYFYLSKDNVFDAKDTYLTHTSNYYGIDAGASFDDSVAITPNASLAAGTYYIFAVSDPHKHVVEFDETNNVSAPQAITIAGEPVDGPDLVFTSVSVSVGSYESSPGRYVTLVDTSYTVLNQGNAETDSLYYPRIYLSTDRFLDNSDISVSIGTIGFPGRLAAGGSGDGFITSDNYGFPEGNYYALAIIDGGNRLVEINESNNIWVSNRTYYVAG